MFPDERCRYSEDEELHAADATIGSLRKPNARRNVLLFPSAGTGTPHPTLLSIPSECNDSVSEQTVCVWYTVERLLTVHLELGYTRSSLSSVDIHRKYKSRFLPLVSFLVSVWTGLFREEFIYRGIHAKPSLTARKIYYFFYMRRCARTLKEIWFYFYSFHWAKEIQASDSLTSWG